MDELFERFAQQRLPSSELLSISKCFVLKSNKECQDLPWVNAAKTLLKRVTKQTDINLAYNTFSFIEIAVRAEVKSCLNSSAKLNRKLHPQISNLLSYVHSIEDLDPYPSLSKRELDRIDPHSSLRGNESTSLTFDSHKSGRNELDINGLKATLLSAVIDLQVKGARSGDENATVTEIYTKITTMFECSLERLCDCLLLCRCLIYKNQRKPSVLIPLLRRVILCSASRDGSYRCTSPISYIKVLLLAKIMLFMVDKKELLAVQSLIAKSLRVPEFFRSWLDQNNIPWLSHLDKNHISNKNILKCMTVSTVLDTLYGTNKATCDKPTDSQQVKEESESVSEADGNSSVVKENKTNSNDLKKKITSEFSKGASSEMQLRTKRNDSPSDLKRNVKRPLSKEEIITHRKRVRRDSLNFNVTNLIKDNIAAVRKEVKSNLTKEKVIQANKVTIGIQTDDCLLNESELDEEIQSAAPTKSTIKYNEIEEYCRVLKPKFDSPGSHRKPKIDEIKSKKSKESVNNKIQYSSQTHKFLSSKEKVNSLVVNELDYSSIITDENLTNHKAQMENKRGEKDLIVLPLANALQANEENNMQEQLKKLSLLEKEASPPLSMRKNDTNMVEVTNRSSYKIDRRETKLYLNENKKESKSVNDERGKKKDVSFHENTSNNGIRPKNNGFHEIMNNTGDLQLLINNSQIENVESSSLTHENGSEIEMQSLNHDSLPDKCNLKENVSIKEVKILSSLINKSEIIQKAQEEMIKATKIGENISETKYPELIKNGSIDIQSNSNYKRSNLKEHKAEEEIINATQSSNDLNGERINLNIEELRGNIALAEFQIEKMSISGGNAGNTHMNKRFPILTKEKIDMAENEELEVLSASIVKDDDEGQVSKASSMEVSNNSFNLHPKPSNQCIKSSKFEGEIATDLHNTPSIATHIAPGSAAPKQESKKSQQEHLIGQTVSCNNKTQSQVKVDSTSSSKTTVALQRNELLKEVSKEKSQNKQNTDINDSMKNKMNKTDKKNEKLKVGENYGRINYLVQASRSVFKNDSSISSQLGSLAISFGRRLPQVRLDPLLKREMCKGCGVYLVYGVNAKVRHKTKRQKHLVITCLTCHTIKRFVTSPKHKLWSEQPEAKV